ncbi:MAG TPA: preprotein translocase subunit SecY [Miltoncostaeaceae bacterium]|jgi:preprotein translocase subunit SecY|nr:preprotein translocase subunit SecY [Miltoncostaeaceae bacterium]
MLKSMGNALSSPELRKKLLFTAFILALFRLGSYVPVPGVDLEALQEAIDNRGSRLLDFLNLFAGGALTRFAVFALGIMPYITASIIIQLMTVVIPRLEELQKEGEAGQQKITQYTRYFTVVLAAVQSVAYVLYFRAQDALPDFTWGRLYLIVISLTAGTTLVMWFGELITQRGVGNGISLLIFASIVAAVPSALRGWAELPPLTQVIVFTIAVLVVLGVVFINEGQRRIPVQYAKRVVGRRMTSGGQTYMPIRVNMAGVIPVIFAASVVILPATFAEFGGRGSVFESISNYLAPGSWYYIIFEAILIVLFTYFYTAVIFNPVEQADNLKKYGGFIPGVRPGRPTAVYLDRVITRLTLPGAVYLAAIAAFPSIIFRYLPESNVFFGVLGGTSILIVVGVALDTIRQMEAQLMMRSYEGFLR